MRLLLFNPETEYALASGASFYTPPAVVENFRRANQLLPEKWALQGDIILVDDADCLGSDFYLVDWSMLGKLFVEFPDISIEPWGWNHALVRRLKDHGVPEDRLPSMEYIDRIRCLAHRRTTITLNHQWNMMVSADLCVDVPVELDSEDECMAFCQLHPRCWMKAPWSSSGRGVINTAADMNERQILQWCHGIIRRQGSVLAETAANKLADFATEWMLDGMNATFLGLSCFNTSNRGKYISNELRPQSELTSLFNKISSIDLNDVICLQRSALCKVLRGYSGPLGVDMIVENNGSIRPFVELNLRRTMGMHSILL